MDTVFHFSKMHCLKQACDVLAMHHVVCKRGLHQFGFGQNLMVFLKNKPGEIG